MLRRNTLKQRRTFSNFIQDTGLPACTNCKYYIPTYDKSYADISESKCLKFGMKNIYNDSIKYYYIEQCRGEEAKCGKAGNYFEKEPDMNKRITNHSKEALLPYGVMGLIVFGALISIN